MTPNLAAELLSLQRILPSLEFLESVLISSRKLRKPHLPSANTKVYTKIRQTIADTRCEHSVRHGQTIDIVTIAKFVLHQEIDVEWIWGTPPHKEKDTVAVATTSDS